MSKSICIKTNNEKIVKYLLKELQTFQINDVCFSHYKFKVYENIIVHFTGKNTVQFFSCLSNVLTDTILEFYEHNLMRNMIASNYFYFSLPEQMEIFRLCVDNIDYDNSFNKSNYIFYSLFDYLSEEKAINLEGFISFRLCDYIRFLDSVVDICVNKFIIDREYAEFIELLKIYISSRECKSDTIYLVYKNQESIVLDECKNIIKFDKDFLENKYVSDITFSSNDCALNTLLTLLPKQLYIECDLEDEFIKTIKSIFEGRINLCNNIVTL